MRIRFLSDQIYESGGPGKGPVFAKDSILDEADVGRALGMDEQPSPEWSKAFLNRWVQRGVAVDARDEDIATAAAGNDIDLVKLTRSDLEALAADKGIDISAAKNKADIIGLIEKAQA